MEDKDYEKRLGSFMEDINKPKEVKVSMIPTEEDDMFYHKGANEEEDNKWHRQFGFTKEKDIK